MQAIEFNSLLEHGQIAVPKTLHLAEGQPVRVLILLDEATEKKVPGKLIIKACGREQPGHGRAGNWFGSRRASTSSG